MPLIAGTVRTSVASAVALRSVLVGRDIGRRVTRLVATVRRLLGVSSMLGIALLLTFASSAGAKGVTTTSTLPTVRQPSQHPVHLGKTLPPAPAVRSGLEKRYAIAIPMLSSALRVFEALDGKGRQTRITGLNSLQSQTIPSNPNDPSETIPGDPSRVIVSLSGTVIDGAGHSWNLSVTANPKFTNGDVSLLGRCGRGVPAPASQQSPGAIDYPCTMIQIGFAPDTLDPREANIAKWETVNSVTTLTIPTPEPNQV